MIALFYNKKSLNDTLIVNVSINDPTNIVTKNSFSYGEDKDKKIVFINIFNVSNHMKMNEGYLKLDKSLNDFIKKITNIDLSNYLLDKPLIVGKVIKCDSINNTHLHNCVVDIKVQQLNIVCGANNVKQGLKVVVAMIGSIIPNGLYIKPGKLMGYTSNGMLCSSRELNIKDSKFNNEGIIELNDDYVIGESFEKAFTNCK
ncbi:MAG: tRNA-binding protein [Mycoplasmataceae bacterium]|nr:tRNA-binding protein [Mycoplasmataceae bacterium]